MHWFFPVWHHSFYGWIIPIIGLALFILVVFLFYRILKSLIKDFNEKRSSSYNFSNDESLKILNERFARGKISEEEYKRFKNLILK
ncbi:putative membrane protein [Thermosipho japonicus]|uniref:Putative membrane protein n=1 Tax=Thermosipho japonicus TaxID=90323 RepID=A0A841GKM3_9BACT|nr:SHOCT domain-containing protein [Thermosipho japonicus]MBB6062545.1 putative membrane protein [Thermosipho japonicus]